ncbi:two-component system, NarL family, nitrate/nitrite sensor histidine kinase NarX [Paenibacillus sp. 1_12]|uniref:sensor histidine kinase n=1 Tax=Paenibacillus sp. 1_12 TaxID=1566278 RepID=UPI0008E01FD0|nr:ATP-binding protein [Paenibacillus sp. 1_12]SFK71567.1 two-component system, NarL family, nitrate/nitrite sensor histidine kinase NarX [Paenibacillus sp. 1_12]
MSFGKLKLLAIIVPPLIIGSFEYIRHDFLLSELSMEAGNLYITFLTLLLSYLFATWMFNRIDLTNERLASEQSRRAVYEERERLAEELHDNIAQILFFLNVQLKQGNVQEARSAVTEIDQHLRQAIYNLRTAPEDGATFSLRLSAWLEEWSALSSIDVEQHIDIQEQSVSPSAEVQLFAIIREAFTNIRKHSQADHAVIHLRMTGRGQSWRLEIHDNGIGISQHYGDMESKLQEPNRYGISLMRKHAAELNAELSVSKSEQGGTGLSVTSPPRSGGKAE